LQISCHKHNPKSFLTDYIYRIISSKKQKGKPHKTDLPSWKTISQVFEASDIYMFIEDIGNSLKIKRQSQMTLAETVFFSAPGRTRFDFGSPERWPAQKTLSSPDPNPGLQLQLVININPEHRGSMPASSRSTGIRHASH